MPAAGTVVVFILVNSMSCLVSLPYAVLESWMRLTFYDNRLDTTARQTDLGLGDSATATYFPIMCRTVAHIYETFHRKPGCLSVCHSVYQIFKLKIGKGIES